jgi:hypothetical protein
MHCTSATEVKRDAGALLRRDTLRPQAHSWPRNRSWMSGARVALCLRLCAVAISVTLVSACEWVNEEDYTTEIQRSFGTVGTTQVGVEVSRSAKDFPFGKGQGRFGWLEPAHTVYEVGGRVFLRGPDGKEIEPAPQAPVERSLFTWKWDTSDNDKSKPGARQLWLDEWRRLSVEHCDIGDGRHYGVRVLGPSGRDSNWRLLVVDGSGWGETREATAKTCAALRQASSGKARP